MTGSQSEIMIAGGGDGIEDEQKTPLNVSVRRILVRRNTAVTTATKMLTTPMKKTQRLHGCFDLSGYF